MPDTTTWMVLVVSVIAFLCFFHELLEVLFHFIVRSGVSLGVLMILARIPMFSGIALGINPFNAMVMGVLGIPGFALLLLIRWLMR